LKYGSENTKELLHTDENEGLCAAQIFGSEADIMRAACEHEAFAPFPIVDINMGCPVPKIYKNGEGSALLENPQKAENIVKECVKSGKIITVKFRIGVTEGNYVTTEFAKRMEGAGASAITVHGRTRAQFYAGQADWQAIERVARAVSVPVIGNGDVTDRASFLRAMDTGVTAVMICRGALGAPWVFAEIEGREVEVSRFDVAREHLLRLAERQPAVLVVGNMKKHLARYVKGLRGVAGYKDKIYSAKTVDELVAVIDLAEEENAR
jgi:tRNA-dihydrouridine synthase B